MTLSEEIARVAAELPLDRQQEVLDFVELLRTREGTVAASAPRLLGVLAGMPYAMSDDFDAPLPDSFWLGDEP
jgi:hypothetical protein